MLIRMGNPENEREPLKAPLVTFLPHWRVTIGPLVEEGQGILTPHIWKQRNLIEKFEILCPGVTTQLNLLDGSFWMLPSGAEPLLQFKPDFPPGTVFELIWYRRMRRELNTRDVNTDPPVCLFYGMGWKANVTGRSVQYGFNLKPEGSGHIEFIPWEQH